MADRRAVLIPGGGYDTRYPLFVYLGEALRRAGFRLHGISWQVPENFSLDTGGTWVCDQVDATLTERTDLLVGKSLGSLAAPLAADRGLAAVWLTPLLHQREVVEALRRATAPFVLVGGPPTGPGTVRLPGSSRGTCWRSPRRTTHSWCLGRWPVPPRRSAGSVRRSRASSAESSPPSPSARRCCPPHGVVRRTASFAARRRSPHGVVRRTASPAARRRSPREGGVC
ncbi:hypothetical protein [Micromonospora endophytica]|uniref:hypothetical protein n=1 Tax=Micromonospora endophytica TaxID=515350 RepID=UPI0020170167|nr:hypothetical protein [Micromonospora endophytica]